MVNNIGKFLQYMGTYIKCVLRKSFIVIKLEEAGGPGLYLPKITTCKMIYRSLRIYFIRKGRHNVLFGSHVQMTGSCCVFMADARRAGRTAAAQGRDEGVEHCAVG